MSKYDLVGNMLSFEEGTLPEKEVLKLFQKMVNTGIVWKLQGFYGRTAQNLLDRGLIKYPTKKTFDYYGNPIPVRKKTKKVVRKVL